MYLLSHSRFFCIFFFGLIVITRWIVFEKAGIDGWKALIPFYSYYTLVTKVARKSQVYFWIPILGIFAMIVLIFAYLIIGFAIVGRRYSAYGGIMDGAVGVIIMMLILIILLLVMSIKLSIAIANNFGEDTGFGVALTLLYIPFYCILAFGDYKFIPVDQKSKGKKIGAQHKKDQYEEVIYLEEGEEIVEEDGYEYVYEDEEDEV